METKKIPWEAVSAYLKQDADENQRHELEEWLRDSKDNQVLLEEINHTWLLTKKQAGFYQPDEQAGWEKLMEKIGVKTGRSTWFTGYYRWVAAAAVLIMVFGAGLGLGRHFLLKNSSSSQIRIIAPSGSKTRVILPDSTRVWLNSGAELDYNSNLSAASREVHMKGECFFDVTKDAKHPFLVHGSRLNVKVYGTRFDVNESDYRNEAYVTLLSGKVEVRDAQDEMLAILKPGQQLVMGDKGIRVAEFHNAAAQVSWINDILIIKNMPFIEVKYYIEKWYGVTIDLDKSLYYNNNYTFKVKTESLREVLNLISFITPIDYKIEGNQVTIKARHTMKK